MHEETIKVVTIGPTNVGKTCLLNRLSYDSFEEFTRSTTTPNFFTKEIEADCKTVKFVMWDTAGQERYQALNPIYIRGSNIVLITFYPGDDDVDLSSYFNLVKDIEPPPKFIIVLTKSDLYDDIPREKMDSVHEMLRVKYPDIEVVETSSKNGTGIMPLLSIMGTYSADNVTRPIAPLTKKVGTCC